MARWKIGKDVYYKLIENLAEYISNEGEEGWKESKIDSFAQSAVFDFINNLRVEELALVHEYFMFMRTRKDPRFPQYHYNGGDRVIAVTRYIQKNITLELAKQFV